MPQVPFPINVQPVKLPRPQAGAHLLGNLTVAVTLASVFVFGAVATYRSGFLNALKKEPVEEASVQVEGAAAFTADEVRDALDTLVVAQADLPASLKGFRQSEAETGPQNNAFNGGKTDGGYRTVYEGEDSFDVFTSSVSLFATSGRAALAYLRAVDAESLAKIVGQPARIVSRFGLGDGGMIFRETGVVAGSGNENATASRSFAGAVTVNDRIIHLVFGFFPSAVTDDDLERLTTAALMRYPVVDQRTAEREQADTDRDGITDNLEATLGIDPKRSDSDNDGYPDLKEIQSGYDPLGEGKQPSAESLFLIPGIMQ